MKLRPPKNLETYLPAEEAAASLEELAENLKRLGAHGHLVKWTIQLSYWNPAWIGPNAPDRIVKSVSYVSGPQPSGITIEEDN